MVVHKPGGNELKKIDLGQTITILANIGVIAGIVFLGFELRQNNLYLETEARNSLFENREGWARLRATDSEVSRLWYWQETDAPLSELDQRRRGDLMHAVFLRWEKNFQSVLRGTLEIDDLEVSGMRAAWQSVSLLDEEWERRKRNYSTEFVEFVEDSVAQN